MAMPVAMQSQYWVRLYLTVEGLHQTLKCYTAPKESQSQQGDQSQATISMATKHTRLPMSFPVRATPGATATGYFVLFKVGGIPDAARQV